MITASVRRCCCVFQEQTAVAEQFAQVIATNQLSPCDVSQVLDEHARSVHVLRMRQRDERQRLLGRLDAKLHARRTAPDDEPDDDHHIPQVGVQATCTCVVTRYSTRSTAR